MSQTDESLEVLGRKHGTDKITLHGYHVWYERHFSAIRNERLTLLEIGVAGGASIRMWEDYFPQAQIIGVDCIPECKRFESAHTRIFIGDQANPDFLRHVAGDIGTPLTVVIDDGGHLMHQQQVALCVLFPFVRSGGFYVIEDIETSYYPDYLGGKPGKEGTTIAALKRIIDLLQEPYHREPVDIFADDPPDASGTPRPLPAGWKSTTGDMPIRAMHVYRNICFLERS